MSRVQLTFQKILAWLMTEVMYGHAHFTITRGLRRKDRAAVLATAPTFFEMTLGAHADSAQLCAARIFDRTSAASIHTLLSSALKEKASFKHGTPTEVQKIIDETKAFVASSEPIITAIRTRRNQTLAHSDVRPFVDPKAYTKAGLVTWGQLEGLFERTGEILNAFSRLYRGATVPLRVEGVTDYDQVFDLIAHAIQPRKP